MYLLYGHLQDKMTSLLLSWFSSLYKNTIFFFPSECMILGPAASASPESLPEMQPLHENLHFNEIPGETLAQRSRRHAAAQDGLLWGRACVLACARQVRDPQHLSVATVPVAVFTLDQDPCHKCVGQ